MEFEPGHSITTSEYRTWSGMYQNRELPYAVPMFLAREVMKLEDNFTLTDIYKTLPLFRRIFDHIQNPKSSIRAGMQILRDRGYIVFQGGGNYSKAGTKDQARIDAENLLGDLLKPKLLIKI